MDRNRLRSTMQRAASTGGFFLLLAATAGGLWQCRLVGDRLTGVGVAPLARAGDCVKQCNERSNAEIRAESRLHVLLVKNCDGDPVCLAEEEARHEAAVEAIQAARRACHNGCHKQGGGQGGAP